MALSQDAPAPYAPPAALLSLLERNRSTGLPEPITKENLVRLGVSESLAPRTLQALGILDLVDEGGAHTETLKSLRLAPEAEYKNRMAEWLNSAYSDIVLFADPSKGDEVAVRDAFRPYGPTSMADRMVRLFIGLFSEAGIWPESGQKARHMPAVRPANARKRRKLETAPTPPSAPEANPPQVPTATAATTERALEYRLVDLMADAADDREVMDAIVTVITFLKTRKVGRRQIPVFSAGG